MRILKLVILGTILVVGTASAVDAQALTTADASRVFFNVSFGGQSREQTFTDSSTFPIYGETGAVAAAHSIGGGTLFDIALGGRVWRNVSIGLAYSTLTNKNDATVSVNVPHPVIFGQTRTATATVPDLEHSENIVHLQFIYNLQFREKFHIAVMAGPSFFTVRQTLATVNAPQDLSDPPPYNNLTITNVTVTDVKDSPTGGHIAVDGTYVITTYKRIGIGVGGFVRYSGASLDLPTSAGVTRDNTDLKAGGTQGALGLRFRY